MGTALPYFCCIRVEQNDADIFEGTIYQPYFGIQEFDSIMGMLMVMEQQLDHLHSSLIGSINFSSPVPIKPTIMPVNAGLSFQIDVVSRQNFTWQGVLNCPARKFRKSFRSTSELMKYTEDILSIKTGNEKR